MTSAAGTSVLQVILRWSRERPNWQRDALRRIVTQGPLSDSDVKELLELCKRGCGASEGNIEPLPLAECHLPPVSTQTESVSLVEISNVVGVNLLAPGQTLNFKHGGITVVYGNNGAGKSGYARILKRACRARHRGKIERNIFDTSTPASASASITFQVHGGQQERVSWRDDGSIHPSLSAVSVFDKDCASVHITGENEVAFRPFGMDIPDELAKACARVKQELNAEKAKLEASKSPILASPPWRKGSTVDQMVKSLKHDSDLGTITSFAVLNPDEQKRLACLRETLATNPTTRAEEQERNAARVARVREALANVQQKMSNPMLRSLIQMAEKTWTLREAATFAASGAFSGESLGGVGGERWRELWESARRYSTEIAYPEVDFPAVANGRRCVLCHQVLDEATTKRMLRFERFIYEDTEQRATRAETDLRNACTRLRAVSIRLALGDLKSYDSELARGVRRFLAAARLRRWGTLRALASRTAPILPEMPDFPRDELEKLEQRFRVHARELADSARSDERKQLEAELGGLSDRSSLHGSIHTVREEVDRLRQLKQIDNCLGETATNSVTKLANEIADRVVTEKLRERFKAEVNQLAGNRLQVEIARSGGKQGTPLYQVRFSKNVTARVSQVLSEGEQTCVALAAFLTELATSAHNSTLVFDDPVSSLDHQWRSTVAKRLVEEARSRQVIVLTHDLILVNDLDDMANKAGVAAEFVTLQRGLTGSGIVESGLPWIGKKVEDRIDKLEKAARCAKTLYEAHDDRSYEDAVVAVYNRLRATWERALEDVVFARVVRRHRDYIDTENLKKVTAFAETDAQEFLAGFGKCCGIVDAHDPSRGRNATVPSPNEVLTDIGKLKTWVDKIRDRQKTLS